MSQQLAVRGAISQHFLGRNAQAVSLEEQLYNSRAAFKIKTSAVAMHLPNNWRTLLFRQVDSLLSLEDWDSADVPIGETSFTTFLRMLLLVQAKRRPGLGATSDGHLIAMWTVGNDRLTENVCQPTISVGLSFAKSTVKRECGRSDGFGGIA